MSRKKVNNIHNTALEPETQALLSDFVNNEIINEGELVEEVVSEEIPSEGATIFKVAKSEKDIMIELCTEEAYNVIYNKQTKAFELVVVKYAPDTNLAYVDRKERLDSDQVLAMDKMNRKIDLKLLMVRR